MPVARKVSDPLRRMSPQQAMRYDAPEMHRALAGDRVDPFPDGAPLAGTLASRSVSHENAGFDFPVLSGDLLRSISSGLPEYLLEALYTSMHSEDRSLYDFFGIFDQRLLRLQLRAQTAEMMISALDDGAAPGVPHEMMRLLARTAPPQGLLPMLPMLTSNARSLSGLQRLASYWTGRPVTARADFATRRRLDQSARTAIRSRKNVTNASKSGCLGQGAILGQFGRTNVGRLSVEIHFEDREDLIDYKSDPEIATGLLKIFSEYLREPVPLMLLGRIARKHIDEASLSHTSPKTRLGRYNVLSPGRRPEEDALIKLGQLKLTNKGIF